MLIVAFLALSAISAVLWHRYVPKYAIASVSAALCAVFIYQAACLIYERGNSPYLLLGIVITFSVALVISFLVGLPFRKQRRRVRQNAV